MGDFVTHESGLKYSREIVFHKVEETGENQLKWKGSVTLDGSELGVDSVWCGLKSSLTRQEAAAALGVSSRCQLSKGDKRKLKVKIYDQKAFETTFFLFIDKKSVELGIMKVLAVAENQEVNEEAKQNGKEDNGRKWARFVALIAVALVTTDSQTGWFTMLRTELIANLKDCFLGITL